MNDRAGHTQSRRHSLSDWLALHEIDPGTCRRILDGTSFEAPAQAVQRDSLEYQALERGAAWLRSVEAMRDFLPAQQGIIDDTYEKTVKIVADRADKPGKSFTLDNGPDSYPTIVYKYRGEPSDSLVIAHELAHAVQIRASRGRFVAPIMRETCAFLGESALLSHTKRKNSADHSQLVEVWRKANRRYFGTLKDRLLADLANEDAPYTYAWNYPLARCFAIRISANWSPDEIWTLFEGKASVQDMLRKLGRTDI